MKRYDVMVIGGGHAGIEAALASARIGRATLMITLKVDHIGRMSCNPAIGGIGKGHLVREIDALGGEMGKAADATGIQYRRLNLSKGAAVRGTRCQSDMAAYSRRMREITTDCPHLDVIEDTADDLVVEDSRIAGIVCGRSGFIAAKTVVLATGTFLNGLAHVGFTHYPAGRAGDFPSVGITASLRRLGFPVGRLKTGTCPRLDVRTIDFDGLEAQEGDDPRPHFSFSKVDNPLPQVACHMTYTNSRTHEIIRAALDRSPLYTGKIQGTGPRYCPSIEDKVVKFAHRPRHQIFLEPEGLESPRIYPNGISTSLPLDVQIDLVHSMQGLEQAEILKPGYAIEYDFVPPTELSAALETKKIRGLFHAGQINGTTGYEEAAAQGLMAGINAARLAGGEEPVILDRSQSYIGVMIDDLVTQGVLEPYRMFTSRAEFRLLLREDNADLRLRPLGHQLELVDDAEWSVFEERRKNLERGLHWARSKMFSPTTAMNNWLALQQEAPLKKSTSMAELWRRPGCTLETIKNLCGDTLPPELLDQLEPLEFEVKYEGYLAREREMAERFCRLESQPIPPSFIYRDIPGLSRELTERLSQMQPRTLGQAARLPGMTPAATSILAVMLRRLRDAA